MTTIKDNSGTLAHGIIRIINFIKKNFDAKFKNKLLSIELLFLFILSTALFLCVSHVEAINISWLHTEGKYIKDASSNSVILRGVSLIDIGVIDHDVWNKRGGKKAKDLIDMATNANDGWYATVIRLPVYPDAIDDRNGETGWNQCWDSNNQNNSYFDNHLNAAVQECINRGVYCIIDWHYIADYQIKDQETKKFWTFIAEKYKNTPNVIFELFNEPIYPDNWNTWKNTAQIWVDIIRSIAPDNLVIVGGPSWSQNLNEAATNPLSGRNIVYSAHYYPTHGGSNKWDSNFGNASNSVPFFNTEWGFQHDGDENTKGTISSYGQAYKDYLNLKGISWTAWTFDNDWLPLMFSNNPNWHLTGSPSNPDGDSTYNDHMGQFVKDWLFEKNSVPVVDIKANGQDGPLTVSNSTPVSLTVSLSPGDQNGNSADWWVTAYTPWGWYSLTSNGWVPGIYPLATYPLLSISTVQILNGYLPPGDYKFYSAVDMNPNGILDSPLYYDGVQIHTFQ